MNRYIELVGIGPGNINLLTKEAESSIKNADTVISFGRVANSIFEIRKDLVKIKKVYEIEKIIKKNKCKRIVILASGDPCFFGINEYLIKNDIIPDKIISGISSMQYMMTKIKRNSNKIIPKSFHGRELDFSEFEKGNSYFLFTDKINSPNKISKKMKEMNFKGNIIIGANLSYEEEKIVYKNIGDNIDDYEIAVVVVDIDVD